MDQQLHEHEDVTEQQAQTEVDDRAFVIITRTASGSMSGAHGNVENAVPIFQQLPSDETIQPRKSDQSSVSSTSVLSVRAPDRKSFENPPPPSTTLPSGQDVSGSNENHKANVPAERVPNGEKILARLRRLFEENGLTKGRRLRRSSSLGLHAEFPEADQAEIRRLEQTLKRDAKYLNGETTLRRFIRRNFDCSTWEQDQKRARLRNFHKEDLAVLSLLSLALLCTTPARGHLNSLAGLMILNDDVLVYSPIKHGQLLFVGAVVSAIGKIVTGFIIDLYDPLHTFGAFATLSATMVILISELHEITQGQSPDSQMVVLQILFAFNVFFQSGIFASGIKFLHDHFRPAQYGRSLTIYATGGRIGSIISIMAMGTIVSESPYLHWQDGSRVAAYMCYASIVPLIFIRCFPHPARHLAAENEAEYQAKLGTHEATAPPKTLVKQNLHWLSWEARKRDWHHFLTALKRVVSWWQRPAFMLMACANAGMAVAIAVEGFDGIIPLFTVRSLHVPAGLSSASIAIFTHIGAIVSLMIGGGLVERLSRPAQARMNLLLIFTACCASLGLIGVVAQGSTISSNVQTMKLADAARAVYFFLGFFGYPYFVTVTKFAMYFGGQHAALVTQGLSLFALAVCAVANSIFGVLAARSWTAVAVIVMVFCFIALISMLLFDFVEWRDKRKRKQLEIEALIAKLLTPKSRSQQAPNEFTLAHDGEAVNGIAVREKSSEGGPHVHRQHHHHHHHQTRSEEERRAEERNNSFDHRPDASTKGLNHVWTVCTFVLVTVVLTALFVSYYWSQDPNMFFPDQAGD